MISAVVLAAGRSARFGELKQLLKVGKENLVETVVHGFLSSSADEVVVVLGFGADEILANSKFGTARVVVNPDYEQGLGTSLKTGIEAANPEASAAIVALGDQPLLSVNTINAIIAKYSETHGPIVAPFYGRRRGNPVLFDRVLFPELRRVVGDEGAKGLIRRMEESIVKVSVDDPGVVFDIDSESDYRRLLTILGR
ncbi:MAG TPA: nucleotidyltransferase family protein [Nitrososphaerales archaeon]|nr:nucleotidyltransferase family protein [Nitrososphaerales archaeon]